MQQKIRNIREQLLSDNWYTLKNTPLNCSAVTARGRSSNVKRMTAVMVPSCFL